MNTRSNIPGQMRFGNSLTGRGLQVTIEPFPGTMPDRNTRPQGEIATGPHGETFRTQRETFEIRITTGRTGAKYSWERIHPDPVADNTNTDKGGGAHDATTGFAYEINGSEGVPVGAIVFACWSDVGPWLLFSYGGTGGGETGRWLRVTSDTATDGSYPAVLLDNDGDGTRSDGDVVRYKLISGAGDTVVDEGIYWGTLNGTQTISEVEYPLYDGVGNDSENVTDCAVIEGVDTDGYRVWKVPHPWSVGDFIAGDPP